MRRTAFKPSTKPMRKVSAKRRAYRASEEGQDASLLPWQIWGAEIERL